ncbi:MAG: HAMP domain-containing protein, partial [Afipia sp.]|nr:HAMP domain-containing protein [Afipia sp.]
MESARELNSSKADGVNSLLSPLLYCVAGHCIGWLGAMVKFKSISVRIMVAISLVAAASCVVLGGFGLWRQQATVDTALERESRADYANLTAALDADTRTTLAVANSLAVIPELKALVSAGDRNGTIALTQKVLDKIKPLGLELITIQTPPSISFMRAHAPKVFGDDVGPRRKMVVEAMADKKAIGGVEVGREILNVFGSSPMIDGDKVIGNVDIGEPFGDAFVKNMKARFGVDVAIHQMNGDKMKTLATTLTDSATSVDDVKRALSGEVFTRQGEQAGRPVGTAFGPIKSYSGKPVAVFEIVRDASAYAALKHSSAMWLGLMTLAAVLLAGLVSVWIGRGLAQPIRALEGAMRAITAGDHELVVPGAQRADEIGSMAAAVEVFKD